MATDPGEDRRRSARRRLVSINQGYRYLPTVENRWLSAMGEGRGLLCGIDFALLLLYSSLRSFHPSYCSHSRGDVTRGRSVSA
jgi:hypothetical protein